MIQLYFFIPYHVEDHFSKKNNFDREKYLT